MSNRKQSETITKLALIGLLLLTTAVYFPPYYRYWVGDDYVQLGYVADFLERPWQAIQIFSPTWTQWYYRPLQNIWFLVGRLLFGVNPLPYYAVQLGLHALAILLVWRVARQEGLRPFTALAVAALFAIHGHYVDVVTWISAIAIVLMAVVSLLTISIWLTYLERPSRSRLLLTFFLCLLALTIHEETIILPPFLALLLLAKRTQFRRPFIIHNSPFTIRPSEIASFAALALILIAYIITQLTRTNVTIDLTAAAAADWVAALSPQMLGEFLAVTLSKLTLLQSLTAVHSVRILIIGGSFLLLLLLWFGVGDGRTRLGLVWFGLHLSFIYLALYTQRPELYAGRHLYTALPGLLLGVGVGIDRFVAGRQWLTPRQRMMVAGVMVTAVLSYHISIIRNAQQTWLADTRADADAMQQMQALLPEVTPEMHIFAYRFPVTPEFLRSMIHVWYGVPLPMWPGGSLDTLVEHGEATGAYYVFDYEDGVLTNLMPDLQTYARTIFLWAQPATVQLGDAAATEKELSLTLSGPTGARRLGVGITVPAAPDVWHSLTYIAAAPPQSSLKVGLRNQPGLHYRIIKATATGEVEILYETTTTEETAVPWLDVAIPLNNETETGVILKFEVQGAGANAPATTVWNNPRLVSDMEKDQEGG